MERAPEHGVVGIFAVLAGLTRLLIASDEKDRVIGAGRYRQ
ncbi:Uncharacterised protein [Mycobacteroides abscessus subsp. abscessus]|nr:Uncharacterised protein [Mycobacteroides abscessus subsp. abscessus]